MFVSPSESRIDGILSRRLDEILPSGAVGAVHRIGMQDDRLLSPAESACIGRAVVARFQNPSLSKAQMAELGRHVRQISEVFLTTGQP